VWSASLLGLLQEIWKWGWLDRLTWISALTTQASRVKLPINAINTYDSNAQKFILGETLLA